MIERLSRTQRRILAILLLVAVVLVLSRGVAVPVVRAYLDNRDAIAQAEENIARYSRLSARIEALEQTMDELEASDRLGEYILSERSEPLAAAALQERVKSVVTASGGTLTSTQVLPAENEQGFRRVVVNVRMAGSIESLQRVLHALESDLPYLLADDVIILARGARKRRRATESTDLLDVRFNLYGYMRDGEGAA